MNAYDGVMAVLVILGLVWGSLKGFTSQLATVASLTLGYLFAYPLADPISARIPIAPPASWYLALILGYIAISAIVFFAAALVRHILRRWKMQDYDKHLGMIAGGVGAFAVGLILTVLATSVMPSLKMTVAQSPTGKFAGRIFSAVAPALPPEFRDSYPIAENLDPEAEAESQLRYGYEPEAEPTKPIRPSAPRTAPRSPRSRIEESESAYSSSSPSRKPGLDRDELLRRAANHAIDRFLGDPEEKENSEIEPEFRPNAPPRRR